MLNNTLTQMVTELNRYFCCASNLSFCTANNQAGPVVQESIATSQATLESDNKDFLSLPAQQPVPVQAYDLFQIKLLRSATKLRHDVPDGSRRSWAHTCKLSLSVPVAGRRESANRCVFARLGRRELRIGNFLLSLCNTHSQEKGPYRWIGRVISSQYRLLGTVLHVHGRFRQTRSPSHNLCK